MPSKQTAQCVVNKPFAGHDVDDTISAPLAQAQRWARRGRVRILETDTNAGPSDEAVVKEGKVTGPSGIDYKAPRKEHKGAGWYDVIGPDGEQLNEKALRENDADALLAEVKANG